MPFKIEVMPLLDAIAPQAQRIGAVNTIVNDGGRLVGHNTDAVGSLRALEEARSVRGAKCLLLGAGGAARAVAHALSDAGASLTIANRDTARGAELAARVGAEFLPIAEATRAGGDFDVVVNATSLGMDVDGPSVSPMDPASLAPGSVVMDIVYKPLETALLRAARAAGARAIDGGRMLLHQAAAQFELYTGVPAPLEAMDAALRREQG
jgi:shikimate dehydrogenase